MEDVILLNNPEVFSGWDSLNPEGFRYSEDYDENTQLDEDDQYADVRDYFVRVYSMTGPGEDRADIAAAWWTVDKRYWDIKIRVKYKLDKMKEAISPIFGDVFTEEIP